MKIAIISDIHGNLEALNSVYADIQQNDVDNLVCLGDMVGYGPEPEAMINFVVEKGIGSVAGNHELAIHEDERLEEMSGDPREKYVIYDSKTDEFDLRFVAYDIQKTADRIIKLGFPKYNAQRLFSKMDGFDS